VKQFKYILALGFGLVAHAAVAMVDPIRTNPNDPTVQYYPIVDNEGYRLPLGIDKSVIVTFPDKFSDFSADNETDYSFVPTSSQNSIVVYAHRAVPNTLTVISGANVFVIKLVVSSGDYPRKISFRESTVGSKGLISSYKKPVVKPVPDEGFGSEGFDFDGGRVNKNYFAKGESDLFPFSAMDDGKFTVFYFPVESPVIYVVDRNGRERIPNFHVEGDYVIVHEVAKQFSMRMNKLYACIFNRGERNG
jgi:hypothetical protein